MSDIPTTSTTILRDIANDSQHVRWNEFVARYRPMMEAYLRGRFPSLEADDIIQETFAALCGILPSYIYDPDEKGHFCNYLTGILRNKARRVLRREQRDAELVAEVRREGAISEDIRTARWSVPADGRAQSPSAPDSSPQR